MNVPFLLFSRISFARPRPLNSLHPAEPPVSVFIPATLFFILQILVLSSFLPLSGHGRLFRTIEGVRIPLRPTLLPTCGQIFLRHQTLLLQQLLNNVHPVQLLHRLLIALAFLLRRFISNLNLPRLR